MFRNPWSHLRRTTEAALSFFYPEVCQYCGQKRASPPEGFICSDCRSSLRFIEPPFCERCGLPYEGEINSSFVCANCHDVELHFSRARSAVAARGLVLDVIHRYKYERSLFFEPFLADLLNREAAPLLTEERWDFIVPVPLHALRQREREFNQAERLGWHLSQATGIPFRDGFLRRTESTRTQTKLSRAERAANVRRAFVCERDPILRRKHIVLVDDVFTTGATTDACARILRQAGAAEVCVWTVARGLIQ
jgi:ComF family protein